MRICLRRDVEIRQAVLIMLDYKRTNIVILQLLILPMCIIRTAAFKRLRITIIGHNREIHLPERRSDLF